MPNKFKVGDLVRHKWFPEDTAQVIGFDIDGDLVLSGLPRHAEYRAYASSCTPVVATYTEQDMADFYALGFKMGSTAEGTSQDAYYNAGYNDGHRKGHKQGYYDSASEMREYLDEVAPTE